MSVASVQRLARSLFRHLLLPWLVVSPLVGFVLLLLYVGGWFGLICIWLIAWFFFLLAKLAGHPSPGVARREGTV